MYHVLFVICIYIPISCIAFGIKYYYYYYYSVVDYTISTTYFLKNVNDFEVLDFSKLFSDVHSSLHLSLYKNCSSMDQDEEDILFQNDNEKNWKVER